MRVVGLAVVAEPVGELDQVRMAGDEHAALSGRDRLRCRERPDAGVAPAAGPKAVPRRSVCVRAILEQDDSLAPAEGCNLLHLERDVAPNVYEHRGVRLVLMRFALKVLERHAEVIAVAVDELDRPARGLDRERRRHECVRRAEHGLPAHVEEVECRQRRTGPARRRELHT